MALFSCCYCNGGTLYGNGREWHCLAVVILMKEHCMVKANRVLWKGLFEDDVYVLLKLVLLSTADVIVF